MTARSGILMEQVVAPSSDGTAETLARYRHGIGVAPGRLVR